MTTSIRISQWQEDHLDHCKKTSGFSCLCSTEGHQGNEYSVVFLQVKFALFNKKAMITETFRKAETDDHHL